MERRGKEGKNCDEIRLVGRVARTHARIVFRVQLVVLARFIVLLPPLSAPFPLTRVTEPSEHRIRWADAYESRCSC